MTTTKGIPVIPTAGLIDSTVHVEINVATGLNFALNEGIGVENVDESRIARVQLVVFVDSDEKRHGWIQTSDSGQFVRS